LKEGRIRITVTMKRDLVSLVSGQENGRGQKERLVAVLEIMNDNTYFLN
jgi:hypothetical protein